jgi:ATP-dependent RNA helicase SUPV3L1/SUV3
LGPTNTGKTHLAIERMLAHADGMIGLPLRLLAREVYDRVVKLKGLRAAALVTGEEKIIPDSARYFIATAEAMPLERRVAFLALDEVQLAQDPDRGHIFTDRLMRARGLGETMLLGADTMRPMIRHLLPGAEITRRERLSTLTYVGHKKLTKLPKRTAIVAFSAEEVYAIAEVIRRQRGGAAVVMGALSPRTRNAQVELYQSGEVDFLVATDAIGMGLNMDVDHVAFASRAKFDGRRNRLLRADEIAQIAGRAGRFRTDGAFGETGACSPFDEEIVARVEAHEFEPVTAIEWRNPELDFSSVAALQRSIEKPPQQSGLLRARGAVDEETLRRLAREDDILDLVRRSADVRRLWDVCQTPDFRKATLDEHTRLIQQMALFLLGDKQRLPQDWVGRNLQRLDRTDGDIDALQARLAHVRTWSYAANRPDWIDDCEGWRAQARMLEDKLSDALHTLLTQRFIDRRTSALLRGLKRADDLDVAIDAAGLVHVEGHEVGRLEGLHFRADAAAVGREAQALRHAALKALGPEVTRRLRAVASADDEAINLTEAGQITVAGALLAHIAPGAFSLSPRVVLHGGEIGEARAQQDAIGRLEAWLARQIRRDLAALVRLAHAVEARLLPGAARGVAFQMIEHHGALDLTLPEAALAHSLSHGERAALTKLGVRLTRTAAFLPALVKPRAARLHAILRAAAAGEGAFIARPGLVSLLTPLGLSWRQAAAAGYCPVGRWLVRFDALARLEAAALAACAGAKTKDTPADPAWAEMIARPFTDLDEILLALGWRRIRKPGGQAPVRWRVADPGRRRSAAGLSGDLPMSALGEMIAQARLAPAGLKLKDPG